MQVGRTRGGIKYMTQRVNISYQQRDKEYLDKLIEKAKLKKKIPLNTSFSGLLIDSATEYLEQLLDIK